jgi:hypothetical protein
LGHCKLAYEDDDLEEYAEFYDFSRDYNNSDANEVDSDSDSIQR